MRRVGTALAAAALLAACGPVVEVEPIPPAPAKISTEMQPKDAYAAAMRTIVGDGYALAASDASAGVVETDWRDTGRKYVALAGISQERRMRLHLVVDAGEVTIAAELQTRATSPTGGGTDWKDNGQGFAAPERALFDSAVGDLRRALESPRDRPQSQ